MTSKYCFEPYLDTFYLKKCKKIKTDKYSDLSQAHGTKIFPNIKISTLIGEENNNNMFYFKHDWCEDVYCEYKDKCVRTLKNFEDICKIDSNEDLDECSQTYYNKVYDCIDKTNDDSKIKTIIDEAEKCRDLRSLHGEFCYSSTLNSYTRPSTTFEGKQYYGNPSHAFQIYALDKVAEKGNNKLKSRGKTPATVKPKTPKVKSRRKSAAKNKNRANVSSQHRSVARREYRRKNKSKILSSR
jgi:hypothetical protein